jgi:hypothetical protein
MNQGPRGYCLMKKTEGRKSRDTVPLTTTIAGGRKGKKEARDSDRPSDYGAEYVA